MKYKAILPDSKPEGVPTEVWAKLYAYQQCARLGTVCQKPCTLQADGETYGPLEVEHIWSKAAGGDGDCFNLRWLCRGPNQQKGNRPDPEWARELYFDRPIDTSKLRPHQRQLGYGKVVSTEEYRPHFLNPNRIINRFMLLAWLTGAGKTVGMLSILFGINHVRKEMGPVRRIRRVLWLVHQRSLAEQLHQEISGANGVAGELTNYGICDFNPTSVVVDSAAKWEYSRDIVIACPQALWDVDGRTLTDEDRKYYLSQFDAIVVDEAQFAVDRYLQLIHLAPMAFKFAITATPMNDGGELFCEMDSGKYRNHFALFSVFGYSAGRNGGFFKDVPGFDAGIESGVYREIEGGEATIHEAGAERTETDTKIKNVPRLSAIVNAARNMAEAADHRFGYKNHIMVRCANIKQANFIAEMLASDGDACAVYSGAKGPSLGDTRHPWMLSKSANGRPVKGWKRIVICVDIGQFGINNRYCSIIAWADANRSMVEIIQRIGRAIRAAGGGHAESIHLVWDKADGGEFRERIRQALEFILTFDERMGQFPGMESNDVADVPEIESVASSIAKDHRAWVFDRIGQGVAAGMSGDDAVARAVREFTDRFPSSQGYAQAVGRFAERVTQDGVVELMYAVPQVFDAQPIVKREDASVSEFTAQRLASAVERAEIFPDLSIGSRDELARRIRAEDELSSEQARHQLEALHARARDLERLTYIDPRFVAFGNRAEFPYGSYTSELTDKLYRVWAENTGDGKRPTLSGEVHKAIAVAMKKHFALVSTSRDEIERLGIGLQLSHALMREEHRRLILARAELFMYSWHRDWFPGAYEMTKRICGDELAEAA